MARSSGPKGGPILGMDSTFHADISTVSTGFEQIRRYKQSETEPDCSPFRDFQRPRRHGASEEWCPVEPLWPHQAQTRLLTTVSLGHSI